jgi:hypothetical protein
MIFCLLALGVVAYAAALIAVVRPRPQTSFWMALEPGIGWIWGDGGTQL